MSEISDWEQVSCDSSTSVAVPEHTPETRHRAAAVLAASMFGEDEVTCPKALATLAESATADQFRPHLSEPDGSCGCEDSTWWCPLGDGAARDFWTFDSDELSLFEDDAYAERAAA